MKERKKRLMSLSLYASAGALLMSGVGIAGTTETLPDRTVLPIAEPNYPHSTVLDARDATPPPRFEVKVPKGAPNVLIVLVDDMGFGMPAEHSTGYPDLAVQ